MSSVKRIIVYSQNQKYWITTGFFVSVWKYF